MKQEKFLFDHLRDQSYDAAKKIIPVLLEIIDLPSSVLDLGGGTGGWCAAFKEQGVSEIYCIDHPTARESKLLVEQSEFEACDLDEELPTVRDVDLALCIEVMEHLPPERATRAIEYLAECSELIVFSAAVPRQGGTGHINERWPTYWETVFKDLGYDCFDCVRPAIIKKSNIPYWIRQNIRIFATPERASKLPLENNSFVGSEFYVIHRSIAERKPTLRELVRHLPEAIMKSIKFNIQKKN